ncbi:MAG: glutamate synthase-related protein [Verrucomicrobiales bacterium]
MFWLWLSLGVLATLILAVALYDILQRKHAILHNFPLVGHFRYLLETIGPELRQYIVTDNDEERPFSRDERRWVYASSKKENNYFGFGTDNDLELSPNYLIIKHSAFPLENPHEGQPGFDPQHRMPCAKVIGAARKRRKAFRPDSAVYVSAMSFGSLGKAAVEAINKGCALVGAMHNCGEGGVSRHHDHGADLMLQIGTGYFGCRDERGRFSMARLLEKLERYPKIRCLEIKLSQGAKPGSAASCPKRKSPRRSPKPAACRWTRTASARRRTPNSTTPIACSISPSASPPRPACPSGSNPPSATCRSGTTSGG